MEFTYLLNPLFSWSSKRCGQCACKSYAVDSENSHMNMDVSDARCGRCGCNAAAHEIWREPEDEPPPATSQPAAPKPKPKPKPPPEPLLIEKAIALPKGSMIGRWPKLDVPLDQQAWPALDREFKEVVAWSDLHSDMGANMDHLQQLPLMPETVLLLAGDLATKMEILESSFRILQEKFGVVFYVPGNHELWVHKKEGLTSLHKFFAILELCDRLGVHTRPAFISKDCAVCPLFSWYKDNLVDGFKRDMANIPFDVQCSWPWDLTGRGDSNDSQQTEIADFFAGLNERRIRIAPPEALEAARARPTEVQEGVPRESEVLERAPTVLTMSHFVPRQECYPGPRRLCGVMGCREIEGQIRAVGSRCHVFGHSHISCDREVDCVRYVQHPLGYPTDYHRRTEPTRVWGVQATAKCAPSEAQKLPEASISAGIWQSLEQEIKDCKEEPMKRPPGRWSEEGESWATEAINDRKSEVELRLTLGWDAKKISQEWSSTPKAKEVEIKIIHMASADEIRVTVMDDILVKQLKEAIVTKVGRGPASRIMLSSNSETVIEDDVMLSSVADEWREGLMLSGIDISLSKRVDVRIVHAASDSEQGLVVSVPDTCTILDVRKAIMEKLQEKHLSSCKIVRTQKSGTFASVKDTELLNDRTELQFLGRELPERFVTARVAFRRGQVSSFQLESGSTVRMLREKVAAGQAAGQPGNFVLRHAGTKDEVSEDTAIWANTSFDFWREAAPEAADAPQPAAAALAQAQVTVAASEVRGGDLVELTLAPACTLLDVRRALMMKLGETRMSKVAS